MSQPNSIAGAFTCSAFTDGPVQLTQPEHSPEEHEQLQRLFDQAYWLGKCAELIYAPSPKKKLSKKEKKAHVEQLMKAWNDPKWDKFFTVIEEQIESEGEAGVPDPLAVARRELSAAWKKATDDMNENDVDNIAEELRGLYRRCMRKKYFYPWRWLSEQRLKDMNRAKQRWDVAHELWVRKARTRIAGADSEDGLANSDGPKVKFGSQGGMEYFIAGDAKLIILCFRGTEPNKLGDVVTDLLAWQSEVGKGKVHDGFWSALEGVWDDLKKSLSEDLTTDDGFRNTEQPEAQKLWITGHSLGGALAALAAYRLVNDSVFRTEQIGGVFTFGQPRVGDGNYSHEYKDLQSHEYKDLPQKDDYLNDRHFRFVNNNDIVTTVPPKSLFLASLVLQPLLQRFLGSSQGKTSGAGDVNFSFEYSDVGRVVMANRSDRFKLLTPPRSLGWNFWMLDFWWPVRRWTRRIISRLRAPFMPKEFGGFVNRFLPGVADHSMTAYNRALKNERDLRRSNEGQA